MNGMQGFEAIRGIGRCTMPQTSRLVIWPSGSDVAADLAAQDPVGPAGRNQDYRQQRQRPNQQERLRLWR
jgi:hypothetical protein